jgi:sporulation protein YlmC with PRC-barrel domain
VSFDHYAGAAFAALSGMRLPRSLLLAVGIGVFLPAAWSEGLQMRASEILGREVTTADGERLAIRDLVINPGTGKVEYLALGRRGGDAREVLQLLPVDALRSVAGSGLVIAPSEDSSAAGSSAKASTVRR